MEISLPFPAFLTAFFDKLGSEIAEKILSLQKEADLDPEEIIVCARCGNRITAREFEVSIRGAHTHTFTNPAGITFHFGCFSSAQGCVPVGEETGEHSWFPGYDWRICNCSSCGGHLGWGFRSAADRFYGLILGRLSFQGGAA